MIPDDELTLMLVRGQLEKAQNHIQFMNRVEETLRGRCDRYQAQVKELEAIVVTHKAAAKKANLLRVSMVRSLKAMRQIEAQGNCSSCMAYWEILDREKAVHQQEPVFECQ